MSTQDESDKNTQNTGLESLRLAIQQGYSKYGMIDGFGDVYTDETGVDGATSTNEIYDATGDYYTPEKGQNLLIQSEESTAVVDGASGFYDSSDNKTAITVNGTVQTYIPPGEVVDGANDFYDSSSNSSALTVVGQTQTSIPDGVTEFDPYGGTEPVIDLDGTGDHISVADQSWMDWGTGDFYISFWINQASGTAGWVLNRNSSVTASFSTRRFALTTASNGTVSWYGGATIASSSGALTLGAWQYVQVQRVSGTLKIHIEGSEVASGTDTRDFSYSDPIQIGGGQSVYTEGTITDVIFDNASLPIAPPTSKPTVSTEDFYLDHTPDADPYGGTEPIFDFDGSGDYLIVANADFPDITSTGDFTVEWFVKFDASGTGWICGQYNASGGSTDRNFLVYKNGSNKIVFDYYGVGNASIATATSTSTISTGLWYHMALARSGDDFTLYIDGASEGSDTGSGNGNPCTLDFFVARAGGITSSMLNGQVAELRIHDSAIDYTVTPVPTSKPTVSTEDLYLDHDINNTTFVDSTGQYTVTSVGDVTHSLAQSKFGSSSIYFDGTVDRINATQGAAFPQLSGDFTVEMWFRASSVSTTQSLISKDKGGAGNRGWDLRIKGPTSQLVWSYSTDGSSVTDLETASSGITNDTWHHVAVVSSGGDTTIYVDGVAKTSATTIGSLWENDEAIFLGCFDASAQFFTGYMEEISVSVGTATVPPTGGPTEPYTPDIFDMTLVSNSQTADSVPSSVRSVMLYDPVSATTLGTDFTLEVSRDGGTTFTELTLSKSADYDANVEILTTDSTSISAQPSGTGVVYRIKTLNDKEVRVHGVYFQWA